MALANPRPNPDFNPNPKPNPTLYPNPNPNPNPNEAREALAPLLLDVAWRRAETYGELGGEGAAGALTLLRFVQATADFAAARGRLGLTPTLPLPLPLPLTLTLTLPLALALPLPLTRRAAAWESSCARAAESTRSTPTVRALCTPR